MATLHIELHEDVQRRGTAARAAENGYQNLEEYVTALVRADSEEELVDDQMEALLLQRLNDPTRIELTEQVKKDFDKRLARRRQGMRRKA